MDIRKRAGFFTLLFESFKLVNNSLSSLVAYFILSVLLYAAVGAACFFLLPRPLWGLAQLGINLLGIFLTVWLVKILGARAEQTGENVFELGIRSILPAIYFFIILFLFAIVMGLFSFIVGVVGGFSMRSLSMLASNTFALAAMLVMVLILMLFVYVLPAIAIRGENPLTAIGYAVSLAWRHPFQTFATALTAFAMPMVVLLALVWSAYLGIPLYFADSFNLADLSPVWYAVGIGAVLIYIMSWITGITFLVVTFLNLDYTENRGAVTQSTAEQIRLEQDLVKAMNQPAPPMPGVAAPNVQVNTPEKKVEVPQTNVNVKVASVSLSTNTEGLQDHLDAVYSPENAKVQEYMHQEEDRMPTILFDDEMAKQLEETRIQWENMKNKDNRPEDNNGGSIKISKR